MNMRKPENIKNTISIKNLSFKSNGKKIIRNINAIVNENEKILLLGPNGSGKSTFLKLLAGLLQGDGELSIFGYTPTSIDAKKIRAFVPQFIDFPPMLRVCELVKFVQVHYSQNVSFDFKSKYGIDKNTFASTLSGGQKRRLALMLALTANPSILLLDEPESGLDIQFRESVLNDIILKSTDKPMAIIMATHFFEASLKYFDRIWIMKDGEIIYNETREHFFGLKKDISRWDIEADSLEHVVNKYIQKKYRYAFLSEKCIRVYLNNTDQCIKELENASWSGKSLSECAVTPEDVYLYNIGD